MHLSNCEIQVTKTYVDLGKRWAGEVDESEFRRLLVETFAAACEGRELFERIEALINGAPEDMSWLGTFQTVNQNIMNEVK